jgi:hypothetical protein
MSMNHTRPEPLGRALLKSPHAHSGSRRVLASLSCRMEGFHGARLGIMRPSYVPSDASLAPKQ